MKSSFCIDLQRFMLIPTKFPLTHIFPVLNAKVQKNDINQFILLKQKVLCRWIFVTLHPDN